MDIESITSRHELDGLAHQVASRFPTNGLSESTVAGALKNFLGFVYSKPGSFMVLCR